MEDLIIIHNYEVIPVKNDRIEGLKKYYNQNFEDAIYYFQQLNNNQLNYVLYEYDNAYYELNKPQEAAVLLSNYNNNSLDDNLIYLKSKIFTATQDYRLALENLQARIRGILLMALSNKMGGLLLNTSNKTDNKSIQAIIFHLGN